MRTKALARPIARAIPLGTILLQPVLQRLRHRAHAPPAHHHRIPVQHHGQDLGHELRRHLGRRGVDHRRAQRVADEGELLRGAGRRLFRQSVDDVFAARRGVGDGVGRGWILWWTPKTSVSVRLGVGAPWRVTYLDRVAARVGHDGGQVAHDGIADDDAEFAVYGGVDLAGSASCGGS